MEPSRPTDRDVLASISLDALEHGVVLFDVLGFIHRMNPAAERILGRTAEELTEAFQAGRWVTHCEDGSVMPRADRPLAHVMRTGETVRGRHVGWRHRDGHLVLLRLSCSALPNDDEGVPQFVVGFSEVTEQRRAERLLDATFATAPVGLAIVDDTGAMLRSNSAFVTHTGGRADVVTAGLVGAFDPDDDLDPTLTQRAEVRIDADDADDADDAVDRWIDVRSAIVDDTDRSLRVVGTSDVTVHKQLETDLVRFGQIIRNVNDIIALVGETGETLWASPSNERVLGYPDGTQFPGGILSLIHPDDLEEAAAAFRAVVAREPGSNEPVTVRVRTFDDDWKFFEVMGVNLLDEPTVEGIVLTCRDVTERQQLADELAHQATHDALTDLPNRAAAEQRLRSALAGARRHRAACGVCYLDLDGFKAVNDTLGHGAGDQILIEFASRLAGAVRGSDLPARLGGDEFVVVLDEVTGPSAALEVGQRLLARLAVPPIGIDGVSVGVSIGVAVSRPDDGVDALMARADHALYRSKAGPAKVTLASDLEARVHD